MEGKMADYNEIIDETTVEILKKIAFSNNGLDANQISLDFSMSTPKAEYYIDELLEKRFVRPSSSMVDNNYLVTKEGRKFLFEKNLL
jgi:predicted transcriptional regulator